MIGTIVNACAICIGSLAGGLAKKGLGDKYQTILFTAMGLAATGLGIESVVNSMPDSRFPVLFIASLAIGGVIGVALDIDGHFSRLVEWIKGKARKEPAKGTGDAKVSEDAGAASAKKPSLAEGLATAITLFCFGTLSILGPMNSALYGDETFLFTNAMLDLVTSFVLASTFGVGIAFSAIFLFCWQGSIFLLAQWISGFMTSDLMVEISIVGGFLILASGLSILEIKKISVMNLLPSLLVPPVWFGIISLLPAI
ncbi:MAG: DUF554 domain-containing protein [Eggerthellaceae bacterium]|nr:DUF554 domain-containing protein [Eggerthellaceae bacterium]